MKSFSNCFIAMVLLLCLVFVGCGGGGDSDLSVGDNPEGEGGTIGVRMGAVIDGNFIDGRLSTGLGSGEILAAEGSTMVEATLTDAFGQPYTPPVDVTFTSNLAGSGKATIDDVVTTENGTASAVYRASGGAGTDVITATATVNGQALKATAILEIAPRGAGAIEFKSATPETIVLTGTGGAGRAEISQVVFRVVDIFGAPSPNQEVLFELSTTIGGLTLEPTSAISNQEGLVRTYVKSGKVSSTVRVKATLADTAITTVSDLLVVSTGLPDQNSFSLSASVLNPEAFPYNGVISYIDIHASDHFNNPVPDGTAIYFTAEGGQIQDQCFTIDGRCVVEWRSSDPRPNDGRVTILATAIGEESFIDINGNGIFDAEDNYIDRNKNGLRDESDYYWLSHGFDLSSETFRDDNQNGKWDDPNDPLYDPLNDWPEEFVDFDRDGIFNPNKNGIYNGTLCSDDAEADSLCTKKLLNVRDSLVLVMSESFANISFRPNVVDLTTATGQESQNVEIAIGGQLFNQPMPAGSTVEFSTTNGTLVGEKSIKIGNTNFDGPIVFAVTIERESDPNKKAVGMLQVKITTPNDNISSASIPVRDDG